VNIEKIKSTNLRNDEYFQFHTEFRNLVSKHGAEALKIRGLFEAYLPLFERMDEAFKKINKSAITKQIQDADKARDEIWRGLVKANAAALHDFDPEAREAARKLQIVLDTYGNLAKKPINEQTSAVYNIIQDLYAKYSADMETVGLTRWAEELKARNEALSVLMEERFEETALRTDIVLREARGELDKAYRAITVRIEALAEVEGAGAYEMFIKTLNAVVSKYTALMAGRAGKKKS